MDDILQVKGLKTYFYTSHGVTKAVDGVSFDIRKGEVFGLVGESASGKTLTALSILKLVPRPGRIVGGDIIFNGINLLYKDEDYLRGIRGSKISIVFQEPSTSLDPVFTIKHQIMEAILAHKKMAKERCEELALEMLKMVHIANPVKAFHDYPHQLSGGEKQRVGIAIALVNSPDLLILDEPTSALDFAMQEQILELLEEVIKKEHLSVLFISHDLGVIARMASRVGVMYKGKVIEAGDVDKILNNPNESYTISLLESVKALI